MARTIATKMRIAITIARIMPTMPIKKEPKRMARKPNNIPAKFGAPTFLGFSSEESLNERASYFFGFGIS